MADEEPEYDVAIQVHKDKYGKGYGIYFTQDTDGIIKVTNLDKGSEAEKAGVRIGDILHSVQDLDKVLPEESPGSEIKVSRENYQQSLTQVRAMKYCRLTFQSQGFS